MPKPIDLTGWHQPPPGRLLALRLASPEDCPRDRRRNWVLRSWWCRCDCGRELGYAVPTSSLLRGNTRSCGCLKRERARQVGLEVGLGVRRPRECRYCGKPIQAVAKQRYCDVQCKALDYLVPRTQRTCARCGKPIAARKGQRWCCEQCKQDSRFVPHERTCVVCRTPFVVSGKGAARKRACGSDCARIAASRRHFRNRHGDLSELVNAATSIVARIQEKPCD